MIVIGSMMTATRRIVKGQTFRMPLNFLIDEEGDYAGLPLSGATAWLRVYPIGYAAPLYETSTTLDAENAGILVVPSNVTASWYWSSAAFTLSLAFVTGEIAIPLKGNILKSEVS